MNAELKEMATRILTNKAAKGYWLSKAVEEAVILVKDKAKKSAVAWVPSFKSEIETIGEEVYAAAGLNSRGQKA